MVTVYATRTVRTAVTAAGTLVRGGHTPANATAGPFTLTLPTGSNAGVVVSVEKTDASANVVTLSGSIRGTAGTVTLALQNESVTMMTDAAGSWWPVAGRLTKATLDALYTGQGGGITIPAGTFLRVSFAYTDSTVARPAVASNIRIDWQGPAPRPVNMAAGDTWFVTS